MHFLSYRGKNFIHPVRNKKLPKVNVIEAEFRTSVINQLLLSLHHCSQKIFNHATQVLSIFRFAVLRKRYCRYKGPLASHNFKFGRRSSLSVFHSPSFGTDLKKEKIEMYNTNLYFRVIHRQLGVLVILFYITCIYLCSPLLAKLLSKPATQTSSSSNILKTRSTVITGLSTCFPLP